jgi:hypothetical protein
MFTRGEGVNAPLFIFWRDDVWRDPARTAAKKIRLGITQADAYGSVIKASEKDARLEAHFRCGPSAGPGADAESPRQRACRLVRWSQLP